MPCDVRTRNGCDVVAFDVRVALLCGDAIIDGTRISVFSTYISTPLLPVGVCVCEWAYCSSVIDLWQSFPLGQKSVTSQFFDFASFAPLKALRTVGECARARARCLYSTRRHDCTPRAYLPHKQKHIPAYPRTPNVQYGVKCCICLLVCLYRVCVCVCVVSERESEWLWIYIAGYEACALFGKQTRTSASKVARDSIQRTFQRIFERYTPLTHIK